MFCPTARAEISLAVTSGSSGRSNAALAPPDRARTAVLTDSATWERAVQEHLGARRPESCRPPEHSGDPKREAHQEHLVGLLLVVDHRSGHCSHYRHARCLS